MAASASSDRISWINPIMVATRVFTSLKRCFLPLIGLALISECISFLAVFTDSWAGLAAALAAAFASLAIGAASALIMLHSSLEEDLEVLSCLRASATIDLVFLAIFGILIFGSLIGLMALSASVLPGVLKIFGVLAFLFLVLRILAVYLLAIPICVMEKLGALQAFRTSRTLAKGNYLTIVFSWFAGCILSFIIAWSIYTAFSGLTSGGLGFTALLRMASNMDLEMISQGGAGLSSALTIFLSQFAAVAIFNVVNGSVFTELLLNQEDEALKSMAAVFE
jgi:hypothetical protein